jgi:hypothetical protein
MSQDVIYKYSEFFEDDNGFKKVLADFDVLGLELVGKASKYKKDINDAFNSMDLASLKTLEAQIESSNAQFKQLATAKAEVIKVEKEYNANLKATIQNELLLEKEKQAKLTTLSKEIQSEKELEKAIREENVTKKAAIQTEILAEKAKQSKIQTDTKEVQGLKELDKAIQQENNTKKSAIALSEAERRASEAQTRSTKAQKGAYAELSADLRGLFTESANVAAQMFVLEKAGLKASPQFQRLDKVFQNLKGRTAELDSALKNIDSSLGRNQRRVGDYAGGYSGLSNSINQLTRELPAFTFSAQTGILALSNNIPILTDEIGRLVKVNKQLVAEGKPVTSVFSQIISGVISLQTAMGVGILLMTMYGKEIGVWTQSLFGASEALEALNKNQIEFLATKLTGRKDAQNDIIELRKYLAVVKDENVSTEERNIALKALRDQFPFYFKNLSDAQILSGKYAESEKELTIALEKRKQVEKATEINVKNKQSLIDIDELIRKNAEFLKTSRENAKSLGSIPGINPDITAAAYKRVNELEKERVRLLKEQGKFSKAIQTNDSIIFKLKKETIALEYKEDKQRDKKIKDFKQINNVDFEASDFALKKVILDNTIKANAEIFASDKYTLEQRLDAQKNMVAQMLVLAQLEKTEAIRLLDKKYQEEKNATLKDRDGKIVAKKYTAHGLLELEKQYFLDKKVIQENFTQAEIEANKKAEKVQLLQSLDFKIAKLKNDQKYFSTSSKMYEAYGKQISAINTEINNIISQEKGLELTDKITVNENELKRIEEFRERIFGSFDSKTGRWKSPKEQRQTLKEIEAFEEEKTDIEIDAEIQRKLARIHSIDEEKKSFVDTSNEFKQLEIEKQNITKGLQNDEIKRRLDAEKKANKASLENFKDFMDDLNKLIGLVLDRLTELTQKRIDQDEKALDKQKETIDTQQRRAEEGLNNTLAFEQRALGKREAELIKHQKQEERLQKIKTVYTSYAGYANQDPSTAIAKTMRDFALLEAITASFGDGGIVNDKLPSDGIFRGQSHNGSNGGIPILVEGREGIFSTQEMANLGRNNFYKMKDIAASGKVDSNFFSGQRQQFTHSVSRVSQSDPRLLNEMREVKKAIEGKPVQNWDLAHVADGVMELVETITTKNHTIRNHYTTKKRRL